MKTLTLLRHADASPAAPHQDDRDRPLSRRGLASCQALAQALAGNGREGALVLCSTAERARRTLECLLPALAPAEVAHEDGLYLASDDALLERLWCVEDAVPHVLLVAHNPGLQELVRRLTGGGEAPARRRAASGLPPAGLAELHFDLSRWSDLRDRSGRLARFVTPGSLAS